MRSTRALMGGARFMRRTVVPAVGEVSVLDARNGALLTNVAVGAGPVAMAVDERTGRAIVANAGGSVAASDFWRFQPIRARQPHVEDEDVVAARGEGRGRAGDAITEHVHCMPLLDQPATHHGGRAPLVVDDQDV